MAIVEDLTGAVRKAFLVGVGAVATGAEKSQELVEDLVKKGELTVEQGRALNEELKHKAGTMASDSESAVLRSRLKTMSAEERDSFVRKVSKIAEDLNAEPVEVEVESVEETPADSTADASDKDADAE